MAYNKTTWETGDVITAEKLNNIENGIAAIKGVVAIPEEIEGSTQTLSATWQEIYDAIDGGNLVISKTTLSDYQNTLSFVIGTDYNDGSYIVNVFMPGFPEIINYTCLTADDYPSFTFT